jgi:hypothetical protein
VDTHCKNQAKNVVFKDMQDDIERSKQWRREAFARHFRAEERRVMERSMDELKGFRESKW